MRNSQCTSLAKSAKNVVTKTAGRIDGVQVFLFGSSRYLNDPSDIDLLFVYDKQKLQPEQAYMRVRPIVKAVSKKTGVPVHPVILTKEEERATKFIKSVKPVVML
ncbi:MAG: nucleotidyltransferase domain-containing protein [Candidatus Brocadiia bacterium]|jgi:predicted nucleotidyltransferase